MKYKNTTFVNILLIYSHYKPGKPFLKGLLFFGNPLYIYGNWAISDSSFLHVGVSLYIS